MDDATQKGSGRPNDPNGEVMSNGLYRHQNDRIKKMAEARGVPAANYQRRIIDFYFAAIDGYEQDEKERNQIEESDQLSDEYKQADLFDDHPLLKPKQD